MDQISLVTNLRNLLNHGIFYMQPLHHTSHSNGKAEAAVKIVKTLLQKVQCLKLNFYEALLVWRITPTGGVNASLSQQNFSQCTKTKLPTTKKLLVPNVSRRVWIDYVKETISEVLSQKKLKTLQALEQGQPVYVRHQPIEKEKPWDPGTVKQVLNDRSYIVSTDAGVILS